MEEPGFWDNPDNSQKAMKELKHLKDTVEKYEALETAYEDVETLIEMGYEENDESLIPEIEEALNLFIEELEDLRVSTLLNEEYDDNNAILTLHAGAGGTEACDWAGMLYRMYSRWAEKHGFSTEVLDFLDGDEAGIKAITLQINGENAYGYLKCEKGIHRLVRILHPVMLFRILKKMSMLKSTTKICGLIPIVPAVPADSISTKPLRRFVLPICRQALLFSARMNVPSI